MQAALSCRGHDALPRVVKRASIGLLIGCVIAIAVVYLGSVYGFFTILDSGEDTPSTLGQDTEEQRLRSPDGKVDAILNRTPTDPLSSDVLSIRLEPVGVKQEAKGDVLYATHTDSTFAMRWAASRLLEVTYAAGHIYDFDNEWWTYQLGPKHEHAYFVEIRLIKRPSDSLRAK
jgi:hypothetical protein